jgi:hypothetical protein
MRYWCEGRPIDISSGDFLAQGGEGRIYAKGDMAYKIYHPGRKVLPEGKLAELSVLRSPEILRPLAMLTDGDGSPCGHSMHLVQDAIPLCRLFAPSFLAKHGVTAKKRDSLLERLRDGLEEIHRSGVLVVDLNETNLLVSEDFRTLYFTDVAGWQTRSYPATAIMESIRDRHAPPGSFSEETDWFAYAVIAFQLLASIHPYKGTHPSIKGLDARMMANASVFGPEVSVPKCCTPAEDLPEPMKTWLRAVLQKGHRGPPPGGGIRSPIPKPARAGGAGGRIRIETIASLPHEITGHHYSNGRMAILTKRGIEVDGAFYSMHVPPSSAVAFSTGSNRPVLGWLESGRLKLRDILSGENISTDLHARTIGTCQGQFMALGKAQLIGVRLHGGTQGIMALSRVVANCHARTAQLFKGVLLQSLLGRIHATLITGTGTCRTIPLPELDGTQPLEAFHARGMLAVLSTQRDGYVRSTFRFRKDLSYSFRRSKEDVYSGLNVAVLDTGVCASMATPGNLQVFHSSPDRNGCVELSDMSISGMQLDAQAGRLVSFEGKELCSLSTR